MKTNADKRVNRAIKKLNRQLKKDVFGDRFELKMISKNGSPWCRSYHWYKIILKDNKKPERNEPICLSETEILVGSALYREINDFIIYSDFWPEYWANNKRENLKKG